jgi:hypothetical protein
MVEQSWKLKRDPVYRGDRMREVSLPVPSASRSIVRHVLFLEGFGRSTPYLSASELRATADFFAGPGGKTYIGRPVEWPRLDVRHRSRKELVQLLRGTGKGDAEWPSAFEVLRARQYVEEWQEHLADFTSLAELTRDELKQVVEKVFK